MFKKILSMMLCLMLCFSCLPMTAMAEEAAEPPVQDEIPVDVDDDTPAPDLEDQTSTPDTVDEAPATDADTEVETPTPEAQGEIVRTNALYENGMLIIKLEQL